MGLFRRTKGPAPAGDLAWEGVRDALRPRLVGTQVEAVRALALPAEVRASAQIAATPVAGDVAVGVVIDRDEGLVQVGHGLLTSWGRTLKEVLEVAVASTFGRDVEMAQLTEGTYLVRDPWFAAALAVRPSMAATFQVAGDVVAVFADAGWVLVTGSGDVDGLRIVGDLLDDVVAKDDKPVSVTPLRVAGDSWVVAELPVELAQSGSWRLATRRWMLLRTAQQREPLAAHLAAEGRDVVVAPVELVRDAQGEVLTYAPVTEGVPTVVAATDAVAHVGLDGSTRLRDFADVVVGAERLDGIDPSRWLVRLGAPTAG